MKDKAIVTSVLDFWFTEIPNELWFAKNPDFDQKIKDCFGDLYTQAKLGKLDHWADTPEGIVALILVLDQFPRNMFRNDAQSYETDGKALALTKLAFEKGYDKLLKNPSHKYFLQMPLMHSETLEDQELSVKLFKVNAKASPWAIHHRDIIKQFGRFPHRNEILGRTSTPEEKEFLNDPENHF